MRFVVALLAGLVLVLTGAAAPVPIANSTAPVVHDDAVESTRAELTERVADRVTRRRRAWLVTRRSMRSITGRVARAWRAATSGAELVPDWRGPPVLLI